jgi:hypothetical protein
MFSRNRNKSAARPSQFEQPRETKLNPWRESERLNETVTAIDELQSGFLNECAQRGFDPETASEAMRAAMEAGAYPAVVSNRPRRDNVRVVSILHGPLPQGVLEASDTMGKLRIKLGEKADGSKWPTEPDPDDPDAFYVESRRVVPHGQVPFYGDERDKTAAEGFRDLNARLSLMLPPSGEDS